MGPIGGVSYSVNPNWMLSLYGEYDSPTWRVKADGSGPSRDISMTSFSAIASRTATHQKPPTQTPRARAHARP